jgi:hypothetical protein
MMSFGEKIWTGMESDVDTLNTMIFNTFVFCKIFNLPNSRVVAPSLSFIDGIFSSSLFLIRFFGIFVVHTTGFRWRRRFLTS